MEETERDTSADWVTTDPEPGFAYSYDLPSSMLTARYLTTFEQFTLGYDNDQKIISCDVGGSATTDAPVLCYTEDVTDVTVWEPDLYQAVYLALAFFVGNSLSSRDNMFAQLAQLANQKIVEARAATANEMHRIWDSVPQKLAARGYNYTTSSPYMYPYGSMIQATGAPVV